MVNNISKKDIEVVRSFLLTNPILTQSKKVELFEKKWSKWLGVKYSVFVNSGSSANFISMKVLKILKKTPKEVIVPTLTWNSDIVSVIESGFKPVFVDIDLKNLSMSENEILKKINKNTQAIFLTHAQGFNGLSKNLIKILNNKKIDLIEDCCESHGAKFNKKKIGTFGIMSNFSFYYAHHMSTIEGGMISTNSKKIYEICRMIRGHGLLRESKDQNLKNKIEKKYKDLSKEFIFVYPGFNMRSNEISAVIGLNQLKRLSKNNLKRTKNLNYFLKNLNKELFFTEYDLKGSSNYAFPIILNKKYFNLRYKLEETMKKNLIEFRKGNAGGGNQLRQPYLKKFLSKINLKDFKNVEHVHFYGYYIGNYPNLSFLKIKRITNILNKINEN